METTMKRILVIDDEPHIRKILRETLERMGHFALEAADGVEGVHLYRTQPIDLVITDIMMPNKDGLEVIMELTLDFPDVKIIAMSGYNSDQKYALKAARDFGAICTFAKPFNLVSVQNVVRASCLPRFCARNFSGHDE